MSKQANTVQLAVHLLQHQLDLAVHLLRNARESREAVLREEEIIAAAREAYRYTVQFRARMPPLSQNEAARLEKTIQEFRAVLNQLVKSEHA